MDIPRGHAMLPLTPNDILDFISNYYKAEYAPIRSIWSTATAEPRQPHRWISMGHELSPSGFRPANAQAQKDLEVLDRFIQQKNLDSGFVRGIVIRYAKYECHERLEKKLFESARVDLMVRKALKEKHLIDALWPSPAPRRIPHELLAQGVKVRQWYGDMFYKYFRRLRSVEDFSLRPEIDAKIKSSGTLMLVPLVDHLTNRDVDPITPIVLRGAGFETQGDFGKTSNLEREARGYGEADKFEIRFDAPQAIEETFTKSVVRQCQCQKCGTKRDVQVVISLDPYPGPSSRPRREMKASTIPAPRKESRATARYSPGYTIPGTNMSTSRQNVPTPLPQGTEEDRPASPPQKKQCLRCTFLNHPELTTCEMCQSELPSTLVSKPSSPVLTSSRPTHGYTSSLPAPAISKKPKPGQSKAKDDDTEASEVQRPPNRHSLSSTLFSIFPFSQQHQSEHHANLPSTQAESSKQAEPPSTTSPEPESHLQSKADQTDASGGNSNLRPVTPPSPSALHDRDLDISDGEIKSQTSPNFLSMLPLSPTTEATTSSTNTRPRPAGMPASLMDDFVPVSPPFMRDEIEDEDAGWGEMSREDATGGAERSKKGGDMEVIESREGWGEEHTTEDGNGEEEEDDGERPAMVDLDVVAREEMGVWGER